MTRKPLPQSGTVTIGRSDRVIRARPAGRPMGRRACAVCGRRMPGGQCAKLRGCRGCPTRTAILRTRLAELEVPAGRRGPWAVVKLDHGQDPLLDDAPAGRVYTALRHDTRGTIYADHPRLMAEIEPLVRHVCPRGGHVVLGGLGLGIAAKLVLELPKVQAVTVLELEPEVIELVAPSYPDPRLEVLEADVRTFDVAELARRRGPIAAAWLDIWDSDGPQHDRAEQRRRWEPLVDWLGIWPERRLPGGPR